MNVVAYFLEFLKVKGLVQKFNVIAVQFNSKNFKSYILSLTMDTFCNQSIDVLKARLF